MSIPMQIPEDFVQEFCALAVARNNGEPLDIHLTVGGTWLLLSNDAPGYSPYLELRSLDGNRVAVRVMALLTNTDERIVEAQTEVVLDDLAVAAKDALECWHSTL
ncbi:MULTISPECIES: hypothetical protein [Mycolicibacter]|uniref:Uncharacterized protein n=2 Tax=Mycolicibacter TaxID=1073531 RepID=A0ABU5XM46_9MYCO|nr:MULTISPECIES: hypothetical protein [unclassified Mycolicibacter]MEB3023350.1 hypothetical protein [Mycolicibacter sp. MYC098]MEB3033691.1 hypothetical protein [Mycolicibacter sp. MYC340]